MKTNKENMAQSVVPPMVWIAILLVGASYCRLSPVMAAPVGELPLVRWREMLTMFFFTPALLVVLWNMKGRIGLTGIRESAFLWALLIVAISMGIHEPTNALSLAGREMPEMLRNTVRFWDDEFSHYSFFVGFTAISLLLVEGQLHQPPVQPESRTGMGVVLCSSLVIAAVIFRNMAFEPTALDIAVGLFTWATGGILWICHPVEVRRAPLALHLVLSYGVGFGAAVLYKYGPFLS